MPNPSPSRPDAAKSETLTAVVAIDGPAGAGKSSVAREVARRLGYRFLDTGAMYRAATWWAMHHDVDLANADALIESTGALPLELQSTDSGPLVLLDGNDVSAAIRSPEVTRNIRYLDGIAEVREPLVRMQRAFAAQGPTVAEGRDMGTVVFPAARCKIYLDASIEERARRRADQIREQGRSVDMNTLRADIEARDENDRSRAVAPLRAAPDALRIDTTGKSFDEVVAEVERHARESA